MRHLLIIAACAFTALTGCAQKSDPAPEKTTRIVTPTPATEDTSKHHSINGYIIGAPAGSDIELALLEIDHRQRPSDRLLSSVTLKAKAQQTPFHLTFNPESFAQLNAVELHGRVTQGGQLVMTIPRQTIPTADSQHIGAINATSRP